MNKLRTFSSWIREAVLILIACLVVFSVAEVGVRTYAALFIDGMSFYRDDHFISPWFTGTDYPSPKMRNDGTALFRHRGEPTAVEKPAGVIRIIASGGSTTANEQAFAQNGKDYAVTLEGLLNKGSGEARYEVLNAGSSSFSTAHSLINIQFRLMEFSPDVIILMHNTNDLSVNFFGRGAASDYANKYLTEYYIDPQLQAGMSIKGFMNQSRLIAAIGITRLPRDEMNFQNPIDTGIRYFARNLETIAAICRMNGATLVLLSQPNRMSSKDRSRLQPNFRLYNEMIQRVSERTGTLFIDMFSEMGHDPDLFVDEVHYSPRGIEKFSQILHERLKEAL